MHTHSDLRVFAHPEEDSKLLQGITTALIGQDGLSVAPIDDANKAPMMQRVSGLLGTYLSEWPWNSMAEFLARLDALPPATNTMMLIPHGAHPGDGPGMGEPGRHPGRDRADASGFWRGPSRTAASACRRD